MASNQTFAVRSVTRVRRTPALAAACAMLPAAAAWAVVPGATVTQNFDSSPADWVGMDNTTYGPYGFSNTNNTAGASGAGEAGGTFQRTPVRSYYGDTTLGGSLTQQMTFGAAGEIYVDAAGADNDVVIGHFLAPPQGTSGSDGEFNHAGIVLRELDADNWRFMARERGGTFGQLDGQAIIVPKGAYKFEYKYDSGTKKLTAQLFPIGGGAAVATSETDTLPDGETMKLNTFGMTGGFNGEGNAQMKAFIDGVTYTSIVPGPKKTELFTTNPAGWQTLGTPRNSWGYRNTDKTGQESGAGEAGGTFAREDVRAAYADTSIGSISQTNAFGAAGELFVGELNSPDTEMFIAHFAKNQVDGTKFGDSTAEDQGGHNIAGIYILDGDPGQVRFRARVYTSDAVRLDGDTVAIPIGSYKFDYVWDPTGHTLTTRVLQTDGVTVVGTSAVTIDADKELHLDAFGLTNGFNGSHRPENSFGVYVDGLTYTLGSVSAPLLPGDVNADGFVNQLDLNIVGANWLASGATLAQGDANGDTFVNQLDLNLIGANWLAQSSAASAALSTVPEPASLGLLGGAAAAGLLARRRK